jgi:hypothetical protein
MVKPVDFWSIYIIIKREVFVMRFFILSLIIFLLAGCTSEDKVPLSGDPGEVLPYVEITSPLEGNTLHSGIFKVAATAFHYAGIEYVRFKIDLKTYHLDYSKPYEYDWYVGVDANPPVITGIHQICALAVDNTGHANSHCISVDVEY